MHCRYQKPVRGRIQAQLEDAHEGSQRNMLEHCKPGLGVIQLVTPLELGTAQRTPSWGKGL